MPFQVRHDSSMIEAKGQRSRGSSLPRAGSNVTDTARNVIGVTPWPAAETPVDALRAKGAGDRFNGQVDVPPRPDEPASPLNRDECPAVSVVIPCRNEKDHIEAALHS